ncbi:phage minor capsid protein [Streptosporangium saharense]|uniref:phage minor capsid protein n=1 Tax=Streptosporangium saharense TaxID=1706840 RepID=UPI0036C30AC4
MAIDPARIDAIAATVAALYRGVESALNLAVADQLKKGLGATYAQDKASAIGNLRKAAGTVVAALSSTAGPVIQQAVADAYAEGYGKALTDLPAKWFPSSGIGQTAKKAAKQAPNIAAIEALAKALHADLGHVSGNILRDVEDAYRAVQAESAARILTGAFTRREAAQAVWQRLVDKGVTSFTDRAGRRWSLSSYAEMATRTNASRAAVQAQNDRLLGLGVDLVFVTDVTQECRLCRPYEGKVLAIGPGATAGKKTLQHATRDGEKVTVDVVATLDAARLAGFQHPNCRHTVAAYLPGVTKLPTGPTGDPEGDTARQRQRAIERNIRRYKARAEAALTPQAKRAAEARVREWQQVMRDHLAANPGLKRLPYRERPGAGNVPNAAGPKGGPVGDLAPAKQLDVDGGASPLVDTTAKTAKDAGTAPVDVPGQMDLSDIKPEQPKPEPVHVGVEGGDFSRLRQVGGQGGSNPGGLFEDETGVRWYVKTQQSAEHAANEIAAARLYAEAGIAAPEIHAGGGAPGLPDGPQTASRIADGAQATPDQLRAGAREGFAIDAWLANWDTTGLTFDNMLRTPDGRVVRIDTGGAMLFRAQGSPKGGAFGDKVTEWDTMRDPTKAPQAAQLFQGMTLAEQVAALERLERVTPDRVRHIVAESGLPAEVADKLLARRADLLAKLPDIRAEMAKPKPGVVALAQLLDHHDPLVYSTLLDRLAAGDGSDDERTEWAEAVKQFDVLADKGEQDTAHQKFAAKLALAKDPVATTNRRLGQVKNAELRAAALRALDREMERRAKAQPPGMRQGLRHRTNDEGVGWVQSSHPVPDFNQGSEYDAIKAYSGNDYDAINSALRNPPPTGRVKDLIDEIDQGMKQSLLPESVVVHRGVGDGYKHVLDVDITDEDALHGLVGQVRKESGYLSTSVGAKAAFGGKFHLMLRVPAGYEAVNMIPLSHFPHERELMLRRDVHYVFHAVYKVNGVWHLEAEVVPDDWRPGPDWTPDPYGDAHAAY